MRQPLREHADPSRSRSRLAGPQPTWAVGGTTALPASPAPGRSETTARRRPVCSPLGPTGPSESDLDKPSSDRVAAVARRSRASSEQKGTMVSDPLVSVLIRVRDEADRLAEVLQRLHGQEVDADVEVVVLDNESTDDSVAVALRSGARVYRIPRHLFGYGRALNLGVELCRGDIVVALSAHSAPGSASWLGDLVAPLRQPGEIGAVFCQQLPTAGVGGVERQRFGVFPTADHVLDRESFVARCRAGTHPYEVALFSNSACAVRRSVLREIPFRDLPAAEDRAFAVDYIMTGGRIAFRHKPWVRYDRPVSWQTHYRTGYGIEVSKRLIQELATSYTGMSFPTRGRTISSVGRTTLVGPALAVSLARALGEPTGRRRRAALSALRRTGGTFGAAVGSLRWRRHRRSLDRDEAAARRLRESCREIVPDLPGRPD
jgi:hypothetical protein